MAIDHVSPANKKARSSDFVRVPMDGRQQKLSVPEIPGYHLHWMYGTPERIQQALAAGYEFVDESETRQVNVTLGGDAKKSGNTDMGSRVSTLASGTGGDIGADGQPIRLYLMKLKEEWRKQDEQQKDAHNAKLREALTRGLVGSDRDANGVDTNSRYVSQQKLPDMFKPKSRS